MSVRSVAPVRHPIPWVLAWLVLAAGLQPNGIRAQPGDRDAWQRVPDVIAALSIRPGSRVADVGAGSGYFTAYLSDAVGADGRVYAVEISETALARLRRLASGVGTGNVEVIRGESDDPRLAERSLQAVLLVDAYHEMTEHDAMLGHIHRALEPGGRLVILDLATDDDAAPRGRQMAAHGIGIDLVERELLAAGFELLDRQPRFAVTGRGRTQWMVVARRPPAPPSPRRTARH